MVVERGPKRSFSSSSNRCPSLSHTPAPSFQSLSLVLMVGARQRGQLEVVEEKETPFPLPKVVDLNQVEVRIRYRRRRIEEPRRGQVPGHLCLLL